MNVYLLTTLCLSIKIPWEPLTMGRKLYPCLSIWRYSLPWFRANCIAQSCPGVQLRIWWDVEMSAFRSPVTLLEQFATFPLWLGCLILHHLKASQSQLIPQINLFSFRLYAFQWSEFTWTRSMCVLGGKCCFLVLQRPSYFLRKLK